MSQAEIIYLAMVIGAMSVFGVTLAFVTGWSSRKG